MTLPDTAIILAGGAGTRIRELHPDVPKPLIPVAGKPFLEWQVNYLRGQGIEKVILSIGYLAAKIEEHFAQYQPRDVEMKFVREDKPLGTGGAVRFVAQEYEMDWALVCNGDTFCPASLRDLRVPFDDGVCRAAILVSRMDDVSDYGTVLTDDRDGVTAFVEKGEQTGAGWVNAGMYFLDTAWVRTWPETTPLSIEQDIFASMPPAELKVCRTDVPFLDIGVPERLACAEEFMRDSSGLSDG